MREYSLQIETEMPIRRPPMAPESRQLTPDFAPRWDARSHGSKARAQPGTRAQYLRAVKRACAALLS